VSSRLNPYISFDGNARQAVTFYQEVFGGELNLNTFAEFGGPEGPEGDGVMHAQLEAPNGFFLMCADTPPGETHKPGDNIAVSLSGDDADELRGYWQKLADGGTVAVPLEKQMWGDEFGMCKDKFDITWMVNISSPQGG
jgi:PhnB protein